MRCPKAYNCAFSWFWGTALKGLPKVSNNSPLLPPDYRDTNWVLLMLKLKHNFTSYS
jgi:hypothetical protein